MSAIWQTISGAAAAIAGRLLAGWWQTSRADKVALKIRRAERREEGLLTLNVKATAVLAQMDALYRQVERGQTTFQYEAAQALLSELRQLWEGSSSGMIPDRPIVDAYTELDVAARSELPAGSLGEQREKELSTGDEAAGQRFIRDLGHVLGLMEDFQRAVNYEVEGLLDHRWWPWRLSAATKRSGRDRNALLP